MTIKLELTPNVESGLFAQAQARGLSLEAYAELILRERSLRTHQQSSRKKNLIELFAPIRGLDVDFGRNPSTGRHVEL